jgi:hypothetical protein
MWHLDVYSAQNGRCSRGSKSQESFFVMIMARLSVGCYEPLADADAHVSPIADRLVGVETKLSSLGLEQSLYGERLGAVYVDLVGAKFRVNTGCRAENGSPVAGEAAAVIGARKNTPVKASDTPDLKPVRRTSVLWKDFDAVWDVHICTNFAQIKLCLKLLSVPLSLLQ